VSLSVARGEVLALLGPNGAGKSTTFGVILGHLRPTAGKVAIHGISVRTDRRRALRRVGAVVERPAFHEHLSGWENLASLVSYATEPDAVAMSDAVRFVGLEARIHDRAGTYSHGMRQRLAIA
jgi:ABC-2 type transport system ATP-binding protein